MAQCSLCSAEEKCVSLTAPYAIDNLFSTCIFLLNKLYVLLNMSAQNCTKVIMITFHSCCCLNISVQLRFTRSAAVLVEVLCILSMHSLNISRSHTGLVTSLVEA